MPGQHKESTIAFRPNAWQKAIIEERVKESGLLKKDFITRSCIYANITVVGKKENVQSRRSKGTADNVKGSCQTITVWQFCFIGGWV